MHPPLQRYCCRGFVCAASSSSSSFLRFRRVHDGGVMRASVLGISCRCASGGFSSSSSAQSVTVEDLLRAFHVLNLSPMSTDAEIKKAFHKYARMHHPDTVAAPAADSSGAGTSKTTSSNTSTAAQEKMISGTEAYQLLRGINYDTRQRIIKERRQRYGDPTGSGFRYTEDEYAKAQQTYAGYAKRGGDRTADHSTTRHEQDAFNEEFFNPRTTEGRARTARFNEYTSRIQHLRQRSWQNSPPWRVRGDGCKSSGHSSKVADSGRASSSMKGAVNSFRLLFFGSIREDLRFIREQKKVAPGFAGLDGSKYNSEENAARTGPILDANPSLREYLLMQQRAKERAVLDNAVGRTLFTFLTALCILFMVLVGVRAVRSYNATKKYKEMQQRKREEEEKQGYE